MGRANQGYAPYHCYPLLRVERCDQAVSWKADEACCQANHSPFGHVSLDASIEDNDYHFATANADCFRTSYEGSPDLTSYMIPPSRSGRSHRMQRIHSPSLPLRYRSIAAPTPCNMGRVSVQQVAGKRTPSAE